MEEKLFEVVIDAGHGGEDRANRGPAGYIEADGMLTLAKLLKLELESTGRFRVTLTRDVDKTLSLPRRGAMAKGKDLFISEHTNAGGPNGYGSGTIVFYSVDLPENRALAATMSGAIAREFDIPDRGAKTRLATWESSVDDKLKGEDYYGVIDAAQDTGCPRVLLVESMFHDNPNEEAILLDPAELERLVKVQAAVICYEFCVPYPVDKKTPTQILGEAAVRTLFDAKLIDSPNQWLKANLDGPAPLWLVFVLFARVINKIIKK